MEDRDSNFFELRKTSEGKPLRRLPKGTLAGQDVI
jgi:hypothetical protein